jgi:hypothetical protein
MLGGSHLPIEALLFGHSNFFGADVPFPDILGSVACLQEGFAYRGFADRKMCLDTVRAEWFSRLEVSGEANTLRILSRHQRSAGRRTNTTRSIGSGEHGTLPSQSVNIRRFIKR